MPTQMKLPVAGIQMPHFGAPDIEWCKYYRRNGWNTYEHLSNCPIHMEIFGD